MSQETIPHDSPLYQRAMQCIDALQNIPDPVASIRKAKEALVVARSICLRDSPGNNSVFYIDEALRELGAIK